MRVDEESRGLARSILRLVHSLFSTPQPVRHSFSAPPYLMTSAVRQGTVDI